VFLKILSGCLCYSICSAVWQMRWCFWRRCTNCGRHA